ncbi:hypothetical protein [Mariniplasma anaerobium]|uniref:Uncharacterized protein n=1 Tax=Mariniplasma anaerobium TaxID=2735436 RepID=A0A7U9XVF4_9MOLU|nr:hypothetical protein [Mariniplasma anaerobium]BCR36238.1 hypothetical protein MPAN_011310 [Mariniplasma anaerobium]
MRNTFKKIVLFVFITIFSFVVGSQLLNISFPSIAQDQYGIFTDHTYEELPPLVLPDDIYITYSDFRNNIALTSAQIEAINLATFDKIIRFDTANELYRFSIDVSYNLKFTQYETKLTDAAISKLLSLDYALGRDIDYSVMKSKQFNPIGYDFYIEATHHQQAFTGTFDGNGFEITNLYFSGFDLLTESLYEGTEFEIEISYVEYYAMFAYNEGTIQNFGLINPTYEFNFESSSLYKAANIVGENRSTGNVNHVYVIDYRTSALVSGIRMIASAGQASGVLFDNYGTFNDAYYASRVVMNASYGSRFTVQPVLYTNHTTGTYSNLAYDDTLYQEIVTISGSSYNINTPNSYATSMETSELRSSNNILGSGWYYYPSENDPYAKYPSTFGLELISTPTDISLSNDPLDIVTLSTYYVIDNSLDLVAFSKMLDYTRESNLTPFRDMNYVVTSNIDMSSVAPNSYTTPTVEFAGVFAGISNEVSIYGLEIVDGMVQQDYYAGMFGILTGDVYNLIFYDAKLTLTNTDNYAGVSTYVGILAGDFISGEIRNVLGNVEIDLGHQTLGEMHVGGLIGRASGTVSGVYLEGTIIPNTDHVYRTDILINPSYHFGGVIGSTGQTQLVLTDIYNNVDINGLGTTSTQMTVSQAPTVYMGGVIGKVTNTIEAKHVLGLLTNEATLSAGEMKSAGTETIYIGGVIGMSSGLAYEMNLTFGQFKNKGVIDVLARGTNIVNASSVLVSNHSTSTEFIHLYNMSTGSLNYYTVNQSTGVVTGNFSNLNYTTLVYNVGSGVTLSQSYNNADIEIYGAYNYSGIYYSTTNQASLLRFVENKGDITYQNQTMSQTQNIAGISLSTNINYLNVVYNAELRVSNVLMQTSGSDKELFVAGITKTLTNGKYIKNSLVNGEIIIAGITSNTVNQTQKNNIYVGGFVNYNNSGNMDPDGTLAMPKATIGIINSINSANLISTYDSSIYGITGHANVFGGGIATFNDGDIQDTANLGDLRFENLSNVDTANVYFSDDDTTGGVVLKFRYGVIIGGIAGAVLSDNSRIYDTANKGEIIAKSKNFTRAGGILGSATYVELEKGNIALTYTSYNNYIVDSILTNSINYGNVSALTVTISEYSDSTVYTTAGSIEFDSSLPVYVYSAYYNNYAWTKSSSGDRPGINAAAGGIIGYGLSVMRRMLNHGEISSTDVAGGIAGATFVLDTEYVQIDTAINYGRVRAFNRGTSNSNYNNVDVLDYETIRDGFYAVNDEFIFPNVLSDIRLFPEDKRGFGGIFGRLQRARGEIMYGNNDSNSTFNFIVNMDPNVDLIGRLDQVLNFTSSVSYFDFSDAVYYSARKNDTTQAVFTGYTYFYAGRRDPDVYRYTTNITITSQKYMYAYDGATDQWTRTTYNKTTNRTEISYYGREYSKIGYASASYSDNEFTMISRNGMPGYNDSGWSAVSGSQVVVGTSAEYKNVYGLPHYDQVWDLEDTRIQGSSSYYQEGASSYYFGEVLPVPIVTEEEIDETGQYIYSPAFDMQTDPVLQEYIYYSENGNLSPTFINSRPNGMYVLSTSSGSTFGAILPVNISFAKLLPLQDNLDGTVQAYDIDYDDPVRIDASTDSMYEALQLDYQTLYQTLYSDKSELLDDNEESLYLKEIEGSYTKLYNPIVVQPSTPSEHGIIIFDLDLNLLDFTNSNTATVNYNIRDALLPNNAVIAKTLEDYYGFSYGTNMSAYYASYQILLKDFADPDILDENKPDLDPVFSYTFDINNPTTGIVSIGYMSSYSQVSQNFASFINDNYVTDYEIRLNVSYSSTATMPYAYSYQIDGGSINPTMVSDITVAEVGTSLKFNFRDPSGILPTGTNILNLGSDEEMDNVTLEYYNPLTSSYVFVDYEDYSLTSELSINATNHPFAFTLFVNPNLKSGLYRVGFRTLPYATREYHTFTKAGSTLSTIETIEHYSSGTITPTGTLIETYVNFGYPLDFSSSVITPVVDASAKVYQSDVQYYTLPFLDQIEISDFSTISNVQINNTTFDLEGFRIYNITYTITSESGSSTNYTHRIYERPIEIEDVYRNNNKVVMDVSNPVVVARESLSTMVLINYGIDTLYSEDVYNLAADNPDAYFETSSTGTEGITVSVTDDYLVFEVDNTAGAGDYSFSITYNRTGENPIDLGMLYIHKNEGTNAYLLDIQFAELATETNYALIYESDTEGIPVTNSAYDPTIYYAGIDYDGADVNNVVDFRVDGQVSNIPLDEYIPYFLNYLPLGATIARQISPTEYSDEVSGPEDINVYQLAADFTSAEGVSELDDIIITYRVTSEDGNSVVYYHITVTDVTYNVSYIFEVIYEGNGVKPDLEDVVIVINVRNMSTNLPVTDTVVTTLPQFNTVTSYDNTTNLLFMLDNENYKFRFGRNKSGFFSFNVKVLDFEGYVYDIKIELNGTDELDSVNDLDLSSNDNGKYYYINSSTKNRTRNFVITISNARVADRDYGFTDEENSWD